MSASEKFHKSSMKLVITFVLLYQASYLHNLIYGQSSLKKSNFKGKMEEVLDLENIHFEKEVKVVKELDFEQEIETLGKHQNLREVLRMEMEEIAMKTQKVEMKGSRNILEVKDIVRKSEKTKMEKESGLLDLEVNEMGTEQVLIDVDSLLKEEEDEDEDAENKENEEKLVKEGEEECWTWWCTICEKIHSVAIPAISLCGLLGWCFSCF